MYAVQNNFRDSMLPLKLARTLGETGRSTSAFSSYSKKQLQKITQQLWCPTETDLSSCMGKDQASSWYSNKTSGDLLQSPMELNTKTCCPSSSYFPVEPMVEKAPCRKKPKKRPKIRFVECCEFHVVKRISMKKYARPCGTVLLEGEKVCPAHKGSKEPEFEEYWPYTCQAIIQKCGTGIDKERSRKDLKCEEFCEENEQYCKKHKKSAIKPKKAERIMRCIKVRALPDAKTRKTLAKMFGDKRKTYNLLVDANPYVPGKNKLELESEYKNLMVTNSLKFLKATPKDIRSAAIEEYFTGVYNAWDRYNYLKQYKNIESPTMKYQKKTDQQCITLPYNSTEILNGVIKVFPKFLAKIPLHKRTKRNRTFQSMLTSGILYDYNLIRTRTGKYYFCFPYSAENIPSNATKQAACDPGVRVFQTVYSPQGTAEQYGLDVNKPIAKIQEEIKTVKEKYFKGNYYYKERRLLLEEKLKNKINDLHLKTANELTKKYSTIILPKFGHLQIVRQKVQVHPLNVSLAHSPMLYSEQG